MSVNALIFGILKDRQGKLLFVPYNSVYNYFMITLHYVPYSNMVIVVYDHIGYDHISSLHVFLRPFPFMHGVMPYSSPIPVYLTLGHVVFLVQTIIHP